MLLLSTHGLSIEVPYEKIVITVLSCNGGVCKLIQTSHILKNILHVCKEWML